MICNCVKENPTQICKHIFGINKNPIYSCIYKQETMNETKILQNNIKIFQELWWIPTKGIKTSMEIVTNLFLKVMEVDLNK